MTNMPFMNQCRKRKMARGSLFNDIEKGKILTNIIANFLRAPGEYGIKKSGGRPTKLEKRKKISITMMASNSTANMDEIRSIYCPTVEKNEGVSDFNSRSQESQDGFSRSHISWTSEWTETILPFSHMHLPFHYKLNFIQKFNLDGLDGFTSHWRDLRKERRFFLRETLEAEA
uniref:Uncharacterized protein n=1 Tax=Heterorhabditis bacteriophora TaxID=37862 RepID=A0A1I7WK29_HETBA